MANNSFLPYQQEYSANLLLAGQQMTSRLLPTVDQDQTAAATKYFERISASATGVTVKAGRFEDWEFEDPNYQRRIVTPVDYADAMYVDSSDKMRMAIDPTSGQMQTLIAKYGRGFDQSICSALVGNAQGYSGVNNSTLTTFPFLTATNQVPLNYVETGTAANSNATVGKLKRARAILESQEQLMPGETLNVIWNTFHEQALLRDQQVTNIFFANQKPLVTGILESSFLGMRFVRVESPLYNGTGSTGVVGTAGTVVPMLVYPNSALKFVWLNPLSGRMDERLDKKGYPIQLTAQASWDVKRIWDERVVSILCDTGL